MSDSDSNSFNTLSEVAFEVNSGNIQYKDGIFRYLFKDRKNFTDLYLELTDREIKADSIRFCDTTSLVVTKSLKNDISYITDDNRLIIMVEHQSTINENMALRSLLYYAELLKIYLTEKGYSLFGRQKIEFPKAELYVVYNGEKTWNQDHLSIGLGDIQVSVQIKDINYENLKHKETENSLAGYAFFVKLVRAHQQAGYTLAQALENAKQDCLSKGYLTEYLNRKEFLTMTVLTYTLEDQMRDEREYGIEIGFEQGVQKGIEKGIEKGFEKGRQEGKQEGRQESINLIIEKMMSKGKSLEEISILIDLSVDEIKKLRETAEY